MKQGVHTLKVPLDKKLKNSDDFLRNQHNQLAQFDSVEGLIADNTTLSARNRRAIEVHILRLRAAIAKKLWSNEVYVGRSLLDDCVLSAAKSGQGNIPAQVIASLAAAGVERPGFILYPLIGFGMELPPIFATETSLKAEAIFNNAGFAVSSQGNSFENTCIKIKRMARGLGIRQRIDDSDLRHFAYSATWFNTNPLLLVRISSFTGDMYENQFIYALKIRIASANILMMFALSLEASLPVARFRSSSSINNFETLDIRHYLIGEAIRGRRMSTRRVPMNVSPLDLARLSDVSATLSTNFLAESRTKRLSLRLARALQRVESGYFKHVNLSTKSKSEKRLYRRLVTALDWFRQSFSARANEAEAVVALAVALETLLTDQYAPNIVERLKRRVGICLKRNPRLLDYQNSVDAIYRSRSSIVHSGSSILETDIRLAQVTFARCFCFVAERLENWSIPATNVMGKLLGDIAEV